MAARTFNRCLVITIFLFVFQISFGQTVPLGIFYQAVARDNFGKELVNRDIDVKFSVIAENPLGEIVYQELHADVTTTRYGVFSLVVGKGIPTGGTFGELSQINWSGSYHYLRVEVKFDNDYIDMGTMQFLAVPYALYAQKSLEPGPAGPKGDTGEKGDPGDPASDNQTISFDQSILAISGGNSVPLTSLLQNLTITTSPEGNYLGISRGNSVLLATIEADGDPTNELQDITINSDKLKITNNTAATEWDLTRYLDNTDNQALLWNPVDRVLSVSGNAGTVDLSSLIDDADADPENEIQDLNLTSNMLTVTNKTSPTEIDLTPYLDNTDNQKLEYDPNTRNLSISDGNSVSLGSIIAFRARKLTSDTGLSYMNDYNFLANSFAEGYNDGNHYNGSTGIFTAPKSGIYTFNVSYNATGTGSERSLKLFLNDWLYEILNTGIASTTSLTRSITLKLVLGDEVKVVINTGGATESGTGSFSGYRVY